MLHKTRGHFWRLITIQIIFLRHGLDEFIFAIGDFKLLRFIFYMLPWNWFRKHRTPKAERLRLAIEELGPVFIKFGQMISTRRDLLPPDIADELAKLQNQVPPFPIDLSRNIIEKELDADIDDIFSSFEGEPLASASIAQVHAATLHDGTDVVVKVVRPGIEKIIKRDIALMYTIAGLVDKYWSESKRLHPIEVIEEYEKTIFDELDLQREAANASQIRRNFLNSDQLYIPKIEWDYTTRRVMVMERIYGIPVGDIEALRANNINLKALSEVGVKVFFTQVFRHNFFHADMHPGNIFVSPDNPDNPQYIGIDFGIIGTLTEFDQRYLAENFYAFFKRDYRRVAELHVESGWVPASTRVDEFESAIRTVCEPIFERPLSDISFGHVLIRLFQTARRFDMELQPQLILLQKTLLSIEGLGRQLYPELDLWSTAKPFIEKWMHEQVGVKALFKGLKKNLPMILEKLPEMPVKLERLMTSELHEMDQKRVSRLRKQPTLTSKTPHTNWALLGGTLLVCTVLLIDKQITPSWLQLNWAAWGTLAGGVAAWIMAFKR